MIYRWNMGNSPKTRIELKNDTATYYIKGRVADVATLPELRGYYDIDAGDDVYTGREFFVVVRFENRYWIVTDKVSSTEFLRAWREISKKNNQFSEIQLAVVPFSWRKWVLGILPFSIPRPKVVWSKKFPEHEVVSG